MEQLLRQFESDKKTKEALLTYLITHFETKLIERALKKESVESLADAITEVTSGFDQLSIDYGLTQTKEPNPNTSR